MLEQNYHSRIRNDALRSVHVRIMKVSNSDADALLVLINDFAASFARRIVNAHFAFIKKIEICTSSMEWKDGGEKLFSANHYFGKLSNFCRFGLRQSADGHCELLSPRPLSQRKYE